MWDHSAEGTHGMKRGRRTGSANPVPGKTAQSPPLLKTFDAELARKDKTLMTTGTPYAALWFTFFFLPFFHFFLRYINS